MHLKKIVFNPFFTMVVGIALGVVFDAYLNQYIKNAYDGHNFKTMEELGDKIRNEVSSGKKKENFLDDLVQNFKIEKGITIFYRNSHPEYEICAFHEFFGRVSKIDFGNNFKAKYENYNSCFETIKNSTYIIRK